MVTPKIIILCWMVIRSLTVICTMILVRGEHRRFERNVFQLFFLFAPSHRGFCVENRRNGTLSHESRFTCDVVRTFLPDNWKLHRKRYEWYFVTKIVLTYCEIKLFYFWNSRLKVENLQKKLLRSLEQFIQTVKGKNNFW